MHRPPSFLLTGLPLVALALLLGCPSKSGGQHLEQPMLAPPLASLPALKPVLPAPVQKSLASLAAPPKSRTAQVFRKPAALLATAVGAPAPQHLAPQAPVSAPVSQAAAPPSGPVPATPAPPVVPLPAVPSPLSDRAQTAPAATKAALHEAKAKASSRRLVASYGAQLALVFPTNGGLRLAAGGPSVALGLNTVWRLPKGLRLRPRLDYTVFTGETRTSTAAPLPQTLNTRVSSLALGADLLVPLDNRWSLGLAVSEIRWSVASTNTVTPTLGGSMTLSGTSHWTRLGFGPVVTFKVSDHLEVEARALSSHFGYENQPASTATVGLLWRF